MQFNSKRKRIYVALSACLLLALMAFAFQSSEGWQRRGLLRVLGLSSVRRYTVTAHTDSHGGFHNDGDEYFELASIPSRHIEAAQDPDGWQTGPPPQKIIDCLSAHTDLGNTGGFYWFFLDRQSGLKGQKGLDAAFSRERFSYNFTLALYDPVRQRLYCLISDT